jgi:WD40 repeat protein
MSTPDKPRSPSTAGALPPGTVVGGRYRIGSVIGRGGFGITYSATYGELDAPAAVKELFLTGSKRFGSTVQPPPSQQDKFGLIRDRFAEEGRVLARFDHPGIVKVFDVVRDYNTSYLVMELLAGETLEAKISQGPLSESQVRELLTKIGAALEVLHANNTLHRDIKPGNILWHPTRGPILIDFGSSMELAGSNTDIAATLVTNGYAPLEQYRSNSEVGPSTDVYGLAATAVHALTGKLPPSAMDRFEVGEPLNAPTTTDIRISEAITRGLQLAAEDRPDNVHEWLAGLSVRAVPQANEPLTIEPQANELEPSKPALHEPVTVDTPTNAPRPTAVRRKVKFAAVLVVAALLVGGLIRSHFTADDTPTSLSFAGPVSSMVWSPDGSKLLTTGDDGAAKTWSGDGVLLRDFRGHIDGLTAGSWSPDGSIIATSSLDSTINLWNVNDGSVIKTLRGHTGSVTSVAWSPNGDVLASAGSDSTIKLWDVSASPSSAQLMQTLNKHMSKVTALSWAPSGSEFVSADTAGSVWKWTMKSAAASGSQLGTQKDAILSLSWSPDGTTIASAGEDRQLTLWTPATGQRTRRIAVKHPALSIAWSPDSLTLAAGMREGGIFRSDRDGKAGRSLNGHKGPVTAVSFSPRTSKLTSAGDDGTIRMWDESASVGTASSFTSQHRNYFQSASFSPDGTRLVTGGWDDRLRMWDVRNKTELPPLIGQRGFVSSVSWSSDGQFVASGGEDGTVRFWSLPAMSNPTQLRGHTARVSAVAWSNDSQRLASASWDGLVMLWNPQAVVAQPERTIRVSNAPLTSLSWSPDNRRFAVTDVAGVMTIIDAQTGRINSQLTPPESAPALSIAWSPTGTVIAVGSQNSQIYLWNETTLLDTLNSHTAAVVSIAWSPDGKHLLSGGADNAAIIWSVASKQKRQQFSDSTGGIRAVAWSNKIQHIAFADSSLIIRTP